MDHRAKKIDSPEIGKRPFSGRQPGERINTDYLDALLVSPLGARIMAIKASLISKEDGENCMRAAVDKALQELNTMTREITPS